MKLLILLTLLISNALASDALKAPSNFKYLDSKATFVDLLYVDSVIEYNVKTATVTATSTIEFEIESEGYPIFDLIPNPTSIEINGIGSQANEIQDPSSTTRMRVLNKKLKAGSHIMVVKNQIDSNLKFSAKSVRSAFWMTDLSDRKYIEQYLPTNFEYDQYQQTLEIKVMGEANLEEHRLYTNGKVTKLSKNHFKVVYPEYFTASSLFFHMVEVGAFEEVSFSYDSISGAKIPVTIYKKSIFTSLTVAKNKTLAVLAELEKKLGPWSHPNLTIYIAGSGGMEYSGATITSMGALGHEITHSFFARGVMPINGNAGWIDEAIASWRDDGYRSVSSPNFVTTKMAAHSEYRRKTDRNAYTKGANFMAYINNRLSSQGGLITFLSGFYTRFTHTNINTNMFKKELEIFSGEDFTSEFNQYIFGMGAAEIANKKAHVDNNPYHPKMTKKQLLDIL